MQLYSECDIGGDHFVSIYGEIHGEIHVPYREPLVNIWKIADLTNDLQVYNPLVLGKIIKGKHIWKDVFLL